MKFTKFSIFFIPLLTYSQVGIGTDSPNNSSILELKSNNLGFLPPRIKLLNNTDQTTILNPEKGLMIYNLTPNTNEQGLNYNGMVMWNGEEWRSINNLYIGEGNVQDLLCVNAKLYPSTYTANQPYEGVLDIPYIGSNGGIYSSMVLGPVNGLTASIDGGNLVTGSGSLQYKVTGIPTSGSPSTTTFQITLNNKSCDATIGAGENIDQGGNIYHKSPDILANVFGNGGVNGTQDIGWISHYDDELPVIGGKLRLDGYFYATSNTTGGVTWNPRLVNVTGENVKFWFSSFSSHENFDGSNIVLTPNAFLV